MAGTSFGAAHESIPNLWVMFRDFPGSNLVIFGYITGKPDTTANIYQHGCLLVRTDAGTGTSSLYQNIGSPAVPSWYTVRVA